jgi:hypothetical protein
VRIAKSTTVAIHSGRSRRHVFGDYDDDDYYTGVSDNDNDDLPDPNDRDGDSDGHTDAYYDQDDSSVRTFGYPATRSDRRLIVALLKRYYTAAVAGDGAQVCSLVYSPLVKSYTQDLGQNGSRFLRGLRGCAQIVSRILMVGRSALAIVALRPGITEIRVSGRLALVVLGTNPSPIREIEVIRDQRIWMIYGPVDNEVP